MEFVNEEQKALFEGLDLNGRHRFLWRRDVFPRSYCPPNETHRWFGTDSEDTYHRTGNKAFAPSDISYVFNELGFRSRPCDPSSPNKKILFLGCSITQGVGMPYEKNWTTLVSDGLSAQFGREIEQHNFALAAQGNEAIGMSASQVIPILKPDLVVVLFTFFARTSWYENYAEQRRFIATYPNKSQAFRGWLSFRNDPTEFYQFVAMHNLINATAQANGIPWAWQTTENFICHTPSDLLDPYIRTDNRIDCIFRPNGWASGDMARDGMHPGIGPNKRFADHTLDFILRYEGTRDIFSK